MEIDELKPFTQEEFKKFCDFIYSTSGINLTDKKYSLVNNRLRKRVRHFQFKSYNEYFEWVTKTKEGAEELENLINQITTNVSNFFREPKQLKFFYDTILPDITSKKDKVRIWSAGCSTGEEPYTLTILLNRFAKIKYEIIATDLSTKVLKHAKDGVYSKDQVKEVDDDILKEFFIHNSLDDNYKVKEILKKNISFYQLNLIKDKYPIGFDVIFCRNVIIYFDRETKNNIVDGFHNSMNDSGVLCLGHSESLFNNPQFRFYRPSIYQKV
jgi:chemotaxis protein methyltransferase CheR